MKLRHILVQHEYEARDLLRQFSDSGKGCPDSATIETLFTALAKKHSLCSSRESGGDLGDVSGLRRRLDSDFLDAADTLIVGVISSPVRTRFGYHLILRYQ